jgi:hypothetical protein
MRLCVIGVSARCTTQRSGSRLLGISNRALKENRHGPGSEEEEVAKIMQKITVGVSPQLAQVSAGPR